MAWQSPADNGFGWLVLTADNLDNRFLLDMAEAVAAADILLQGSKYVAPRRRGRPPKQKNESADLVLSTVDGVDGPRTRGRKKKNETAVDVLANVNGRLLKRPSGAVAAGEKAGAVKANLMRSAKDKKKLRGTITNARAVAKRAKSLLQKTGAQMQRSFKEVCQRLVHFGFTYPSRSFFQLEI